MMKVYQGEVPDIEKWPSCLFHVFHAEKMVWADITQINNNYLWDIVNECASVLSSHSACPSVKTFAYYLKGVVVDYLHDNAHPDLPEIPEGTSPNVESLMKEALKGHVPGLPEWWTVRPCVWIELVQINSLDDHWIRRLTEKCHHLTADTNLVNTSQPLKGYAEFLIDILNFHHDYPKYFYNLESD